MIFQNIKGIFDIKQVKIVSIIIAISIGLVFSSCVSTQNIYSMRGLDDKDKKFLRVELNENMENMENEDEQKPGVVFKVFLTSRKYIVVQTKYHNSIKQIVETDGDKYMCGEIRRLNKIDDVFEGTVSIFLFPDSGKVMKIRPKKSTYLLEIDKIITEDVQRWKFDFPGKVIKPTNFDIKYRVILKKEQSDDQIMKEVQDKLRESQ